MIPGEGTWNVPTTLSFVGCVQVDGLRRAWQFIQVRGEAPAEPLRRQLGRSLALPLVCDDALNHLKVHYR